MIDLTPEQQAEVDRAVNTVGKLTFDPGGAEHVCKCDGNICRDNSPQDDGALKQYSRLRGVLDMAYDQAAHGKGKERHACGEPFHRQQIVEIANRVGLGFPLGQAVKKIQECQRLEKDPAINELLGAIVYLAAAVIAMEGE